MKASFVLIHQLLHLLIIYIIEVVVALRIRLIPNGGYSVRDVLEIGWIRRILH